MLKIGKEDPIYIQQQFLRKVPKTKKQNTYEKL